MIYGFPFFDVSHNRSIEKYDYWKEPGTTLPACFIDGEIGLTLHLGPHKGFIERTEGWLWGFLIHCSAP